MIRKLIALGFLAITLGLISMPTTAKAKSNYSFNNSSVSESAQKTRRFGPYATLRRANEVANYARRQGYRAKVIYAGSYIYGSRKYYVDVW